MGRVPNCELVGGRHAAPAQSIRRSDERLCATRADAHDPPAAPFMDLQLRFRLRRRPQPGASVSVHSGCRASLDAHHRPRRAGACSSQTRPRPRSLVRLRDLRAAGVWEEPGELDIVPRALRLRTDPPVAPRRRPQRAEQRVKGRSREFERRGACPRSNRATRCGCDTTSRPFQHP
jgi:hypothetical protein